MLKHAHHKPQKQQKQQRHFATKAKKTAVAAAAPLTKDGTTKMTNKAAKKAAATTTTTTSTTTTDATETKAQKKLAKKTAKKADTTAETTTTTIRVHSIDNYNNYVAQPLSAIKAKGDFVVNGATLTTALVDTITPTAGHAPVSFVTQADVAKLSSTMLNSPEGYVAAALSAQNFKGKAGSVAFVIPVGDDKQQVYQPHFLIGLGEVDVKKNQVPTMVDVRSAMSSLVKMARKMKLTTLDVNLPDDLIVAPELLIPDGYGLGGGMEAKYKGSVTQEDILAEVTRAVITNNYSFDTYLKESTQKEQHHRLTNLNFAPAVGNAKKAAAKKAGLLTRLHRAVHEAESQTFAMELSNLRADVATNTFMMQQAVKLGEQHPDVLKVNVVNKEEMKEKGLDMILSVNKGSAEPPYIVTMEYTPLAVDDKTKKSVKNNPPHAYVGKTLTFDTGGYNLKGSANILGMHMDKCGGVNTLALMRTLCLTKPPTTTRIVGAMGITDNHIGPHAATPGEIVKSAHGSVVRNNTDAEGRIVLASVLEHVSTTFKPSHITTMATLTGAVGVSLGHNTAVMTNSADMAEDIIATGRKHGENFWQLPLYKQNHKSLEDAKEADFSDIVSGGKMGSSLGGAYLEKFIEPKTKFAHLDIAYSSTDSNNLATGATLATLQDVMRRH